jgi:high affinity sulfate transporter 1
MRRRIQDVNVPGVHLARTYQRAWLRGDILAGLVLTALLVPQGLAYAELAGLPPVTGLYTTVLALLAYALFGPSRTLVLGPDSALGPLIAAALLPLVNLQTDPTKAIALASMLALLIGGLCIAAGFARLGVLAELVSKPIRVGFINGIALLILVGQLPKLFGFGSTAHGFIDEVDAFASGVRNGDTVPASVVIGLASLALILVLARLQPRVPGVLIAVVAAAIAVSAFDLTAHGVAVVGAIPSGFPEPTVPNVNAHEATTLFVAAIGIAFVILADTTALSRSLASRNREHVDANAEIRALGAANAAAGVFQGFPVSASASRTIVADSSGACTQVTGVVGALAILVLLLVENDFGRYIASSVLAAIIIAAALTLFDFESLRWLWKARRSELWLSLVALLGVVLFGALKGILVAIALSLGDFVRRAWRPYDAVLGRIERTKGYHDVNRHPEARQIPGLVLYRFDAPIFFANAELFADRLLRAIRSRGDTTRWVIVAAEPITDIDTTGAEILSDLLDDLDAQGVEVAFAELKGPVKDCLRSYGLFDRLGDDQFFPTLGTAIDAYLAATGIEWVDWSDADETDDTER